MLGNILKTVLDVLMSAFTLPQASSIGIIGGADGPTAIYVTHTLSPYVLSAVAIAAYLFLRNAKK
jgi:Na+-transporting methylmalonyl-CoA/oxaloacetate decarboxylase beta subunit